MSSATLVLSWLVLCHLLADFVLQPERVAVDKFGRGPGGLAGAAHPRRHRHRRRRHPSSWSTASRASATCS